MGGIEVESRAFFNTALRRWGERWGCRLGGCSPRVSTHDIRGTDR